MKQRHFVYEPGEREAERELDAFLAQVNSPTIDLLAELRRMNGA